MLHFDPPPPPFPSLKTSEKLGFSYAFKGVQNGMLEKNGLVGRNWNNLNLTRPSRHRT